jgi:signal transduction histidine kinase
LKYDANALRLIRSKIGLKIGTLVVIQIIFIISSFSVLAYYESQGAHLGNSINIAGKNRFLTSNLMLQISEYFLDNNTSDVSEINLAMNELESNILALREGGKISNIALKPLPSEFLDNWNTVYQNWVSLKTTLINSIIKPIENTNSASTPTLAAIDKVTKAALEAKALSLVGSSNVLVTQLGEYARNTSQNLMILQITFAVLNIAVAVIVLYLVMKILKPVFALTSATTKVRKGNLDVSVKPKGNDELSVLTESFNSMLSSIRNYVKEQNELKNQLQKTNEELKNKNRLMDEFINIAAHELRTPIQPILGLTGILQSKANDPEQRELLDVTLRNAKRLQRLTENILDVTKIESQSLKLDKEQLNLNENILNVIKDVKSQIPSPDKLKILYSELLKPVYIEGDKLRLYQVIANLLRNAIKFTKEGTISINADIKEDNTEVTITIKDTGAGIHPEILPKLFTKFATKSDMGTGLGLYICKVIVEAHAGRIWAENNSDGKGATFTFTLPLSIAH